MARHVSKHCLLTLHPFICCSCFEKMKQRIRIKLKVIKLSNTYTVTYAKLKKRYGKESMSCMRVSNVFKMADKLSTVMQLLGDLQWAEGIKTSQMRMQLCGKTLKITVCDLLEEANVSCCLFWFVLVEDLGMSHASTKFVSKPLSVAAVFRPSTTLSRSNSYHIP